MGTRFRGDDEMGGDDEAGTDDELGGFRPR